MNRRRFLLSSVSAAALLAVSVLILVIVVDTHYRLERLIDRMETNGKFLDAIESAIEKQSFP